MNGSRRGWLIGALLAAGGLQASGHELQENRLTLVQRDGRHLSLTFHLDVAALLPRALLPRSAAPAALLALVAMQPDEFRQRLLQLQGHIERGTRLTAGGRELVPTNWQWPEAARVQGLLRQRGMQAVVAPADHAHDSLVEVRADCVSERDLTTLAVRLPPELQRVLVVAYRPRQTWLAPGDSATVKF